MSVVIFLSCMLSNALLLNHLTVDELNLLASYTGAKLPLDLNTVLNTSYVSICSTYLNLLVMPTCSTRYIGLDPLIVEDFSYDEEYGSNLHSWKN